ncbi:hypothetical protein BY94_16090 [Escherichia coli O157:H7 str. K6676]|nr:hypothetical protein BY94_16090 [Escherichia coli O157:H7 str. K6676]
MWALTADADFLAQRGQGQVEQVFARAVNIALPARQQLLTLLCEEYDNAPNSCRLALTHFDDLFRHGDKVQFDDQGITVGQHLHIEMSRCRRWLSPTLQMTAVNFRLIRPAATRMATLLCVAAKNRIIMPMISPQPAIRCTSLIYLNIWWWISATVTARSSTVAS